MDSTGEIEKSGRWRKIRRAKGGIKVDFPYFLSFFFKEWLVVEGVCKLWGGSGGGRDLTMLREAINGELSP